MGQRDEARGGRGRELRKLRPFLTLATVALVVALLYWARPVLIPIALATLLTFLLSPVVGALQRLGLGRVVAVVLVVVMAFSLLAAVGWIVSLQVKALAEELPQYRDNIRQKIADVRWVGKDSFLDRLYGLFREVQREATGERSEPVAVALAPDQPALLRQVAAVVDPLVMGGLVLALVIFMLVRLSELRSRAIRLLGYGRLPVTTRAIDEAASRISHYLLTQSSINGGFGAAVALGLFLIGLPYALLWGFLAGVLRFVPYLGPWLAAILPTVLALAVFEGWTQPLLVVLLFVVLEPAIFLVLEPLLYGGSAGVSEVALLVAVGFWTWLWGPVGLIVATPLTVCLVVLGKYIPDLEFVAVLMGDGPALEPYLAFYQRLLAEDVDDAAGIVEEYLETHSVPEAYDDILVPALKCVKRDRARDDLSDDEEHFVLVSMRQIIEDLGGREEPPVRFAPPSAAVGVLACPARDEADEVALLMLRQLVEPVCCEVEVLSSEMLAAEVVAVAGARRPAIVCVGVLPPGGLSQARYLIKRLRAALPGVTILVGRWGRNGTPEETRLLMTAAGADDVGTTLAETRDQVLALVPVLVERLNREGRAEPRSA
jgi:predicted PurR-regulated permease PerM